ncbi:MAG TPA: NAD(P)/FAD-dependent oxidoreductase [Bryobacteraceae bacterium]
MHTLIVGAGIAGLTLAAKLRQQGRSPVLIEKAPQYTDIGYGIGLYPLGSCVLHGLGAYQELLVRSVEPRRYEIADGTGEILQKLDLSLLTDNVGPMAMLSRTELIDVLRQACAGVDLRMGTTLEDLKESPSKVRARLSDGTDEEFDLIAACDGIHSQVRARVFDPAEIFDTGWTAWTWWGESGLFPEDLVREYWGRGFFFGVYPVRGRCMFVIGLPNDRAKANMPKKTVRSILAEALADLAGDDDAVRRAFEDSPALFAWPMSDIRAPEWYKGRVVLCGDASTAFLPTAGVGASNALRSAAALADELSKADGSRVPLALDLYVKRCQKLIRANQDDSRSVARYMFVDSKTLGWGRDHLLKYYPADRAVRQIIHSMRQPF